MPPYPAIRELVERGRAGVASASIPGGKELGSGPVDSPSGSEVSLPFDSSLRPQFQISPVTGEFSPLPITSLSSPHALEQVSLAFFLLLVRPRDRRCFSTF